MKRTIWTALTTAALIATTAFAAQATPAATAPGDPSSSASVTCSEVTKDGDSTHAVKCRVTYAQEWWGGVFVVPEMDWSPDACSVSQDAPWVFSRYDDIVTDTQVTVVDHGGAAPDCRAVVRWEAVPVAGPGKGHPVGFELVVTAHGPEVRSIDL